ncbi:hypothetical protein F4679DRAFT_303895 [Xylaria curta]|nr:hypothetical protein F4679DRAFT_303895 [Xylaria curta]
MGRSHSGISPSLRQLLEYIKSISMFSVSMVSGLLSSLVILYWRGAIPLKAEASPIHCSPPGVVLLSYGTYPRRSELKSSQVKVQIYTSAPGCYQERIRGAVLIIYVPVNGMGCIKSKKVYSENLEAMEIGRCKAIGFPIAMIGLPKCKKTVFSHYNDIVRCHAKAKRKQSEDHSS